MTKLILFDFDGTLADSSAWFIATLPHLAADHRLRMPGAAELERLRGCTSREVMQAMRIPLWKLPAIARDMRRRAERDREKITLFDGIDRLLAELAEMGIPLGIVSSNSLPVVRGVLGPHASSISHFACGASLLGKARLLTRSARVMGVAPARTLYVGDELRDIAAAHTAGMAAGAVSWGYATRPALAGAGPEHLFDKPEDILRWAENTEVTA